MKLLLFFLYIITSYPLLSQTWFQTGQNADLMLSGVGFNNTGGPLLFNHPSGIASDGTRFLLCDRFNNRVLIWNSLPTKWDDKPDIVLGQSNFTTNNPGTSRSELNWPGNVSTGSNGVVAVTDTENDRILIWNTFPTENAQAADISISLPAISTPGSDRYEWPWGVWTDGNKLIVTATHGGAILFWDSLPTTDNQLPSYTIKLPQFGTLRNISTDGSTYLFVGDHNAIIGGGPSKSGTFFWNTFPTQPNQSYDWFFEEWIKGTTTQDGKLIAGGLASVYLWNSFPTSSSQPPNLILRNNYYSNGDGPDVVIAGGRMYVNNYNGNNVQVYDSIPTLTTQLPDFTLGSSSINYNTLDSIHYIQNPVVESDGTILIATSDFDRALWIWKTVNPTSGQAPDVEIYLGGLLDLAPWDNALFNNKFIAVGRTRVAVWDSIPLNGEVPSKIFSNNIGTAQLTDLTGAALDSSYLYLGERSGKIYLWRGIPKSNTQNPYTTFTIPEQPLNKLHSDGIYLTATIQNAQPTIYIYRVSDLESGIYQPYKIVTRSAQLPLNLCASAITFNGSFAIANTNGHCVLLWKNIEDAGDPTKVVILGQDSLQAANPAIGINRLFMPASLCAYRNHLWVGEFKFSSRILRFGYSIQRDKEIVISEGWNLVSVPLELPNMNTNILFPSAISKTFGYNSGYYTTTVLENGKGYWLKFNSPDTLRLTGNILSRNIPVSRGWNIIGVYDENIPIDQITTTPADILTSPIFGYDNGYYETSVLVSGKSYWVKANKDGIIQTGSNAMGKMDRSTRIKNE